MTWSDLLDPLATLVAAFAGVWFAFRLERTQRRRDDESAKVAAANRALYTISDMWNILTQIRKEIINPFRGKSDAWLNMSASVPEATYGLTKFDAQALSFLLESSGMTYSSLMLEEQRFDHCVNLIETRSKVVLSEVFPRLAEGKVGVGENRDQRDIERILGTDVVRKLHVLTDGIMKNVDENLGSLKVAHDELRIAMKTLFPKRKFVQIIFDPPIP